MGIMTSSNKVHVKNKSNILWQITSQKKDSESVLTALTRLDADIAASEKARPMARLSVVTTELDSLRQELKTFSDVTEASSNIDSVALNTYAKTIHQMFVSLDLYRRPILANDNEDFIANVNRKEMRQQELSFLLDRQTKLIEERRSLISKLWRGRTLYAQLRALLDSIWTKSNHPGASLEASLSRSIGLRDALARVSGRLKAAAESAHEAVRCLDDALPAWKLAVVGKSGWERTNACADACRQLVRARCCERNARRALCAPAAPRAARTVRLALDYAFTDALHDYKHQRATEIFLQFKDTLLLLIKSIHQVLLSNLENLAVAEKEVVKFRKELYKARVNDLVKRGLSELTFDKKALANVK